MTSIPDVLLPAQVRLELAAESKADAVTALVETLRGDRRVGDIEAFRDAVLARNAEALEEGGTGICIAHGRGDAVKGLVFAAGRLKDPVRCPEIQAPLRLMVVAGIPGAFNTEYLRIVGVIVRVCRNPEQFNRLLHVKDAVRFISILHAAEKGGS